MDLATLLGILVASGLVVSSILMGGSGSTRWRHHKRRPLVEEALCINLFEPELYALLKSPSGAEGAFKWLFPETGALRGCVPFHLSPVEPNGSRTLVLDAARLLPPAL